MRSRSSVREFAKLLHETSGAVDLYELHKDYKLGPAEILYNARLFKRLHLIQEDADGHMVVRDNAKERLWKLLRKLSLSDNRPWAEVHLERMPPNKPYMPNLAKIDRNFFLAKVATPGETLL